jgi:hypothetical protein
MFWLAPFLELDPRLGLALVYERLQTLAVFSEVIVTNDAHYDRFRRK